MCEVARLVCLIGSEWLTAVSSQPLSTADVRSAESAKIRDKHPDRVPVSGRYFVCVDGRGPFVCVDGRGPFVCVDGRGPPPA